LTTSLEVRLDHVLIRNFRGLRLAEAVDLARSPVVTLSGPNGSGKSLLMEAVALAWRGQWGQVAEHVGPWGNEARIQLSVTLDESEWVRIVAFARETGMSHEEPVPDRLSVELVMRRNGDIRYEGQNQWWNIVQNREFRRENPFSEIDVIPADRSIPRGEAAQINPQLLSYQQAENFRQTVLAAMVNRQAVQLTGVQAFLASLDYLELVAERQGLTAERDFSLITDAFAEATGKEITRPEIDSAGQAAVRIRTPAGGAHSPDQLSSGEQEVLGLMYYVRRLSARGGILLIDEPELHLHPALQRSLFTVLETVAERAQVIVATHSEKMIAGTPLGAILHLRPPQPEERNQVTRAADEAARYALLEDLGFNPIELLQSEAIVVVEGPTDVEHLTMLFPVELGRAAIYQAGGAAGVDHTCRTLQTHEVILPWVGVRDRDLMSGTEVAALQTAIPNLFVWPGRTRENEFLDPDLIAEAYQRVRGAVSRDEIDSRLRAVADEEKGEVLATLVEAELKRRFPLGPERRADHVETARAYFAAAEQAERRRLDEFDAVLVEVSADLERRWESEWAKLVQGKRILGRLWQASPFGSYADLLSALAVLCREAPERAPAGVRALRERLHQMQA
jgi:predicted ATPase